MHTSMPSESDLKPIAAVADLAYDPSKEEQARDAAQVVATGRKSWKTLKGRAEAVWPPMLEAALIEALEKYRLDPIGAKAQKSGRFPLRNRFVSEHIYKTTNRTRTPKQVGSRIQQLRDTCKGDKILQLISRQVTPESQTTGSSECSSRASITPPPDQTDAIDAQGVPVASPPTIQTSFDTMGPSVYSSHNQAVPMITNHTQWRAPPNNIDTNLNYSQLPVANERTSFDVSTFSSSSSQAAYNTFQPPTSVQRQEYPVVSSPPQLNYYYPMNSTLTSGSWSNERDSDHEYWQQQHWQQRH